jgi:preprotein translocase subunit SecF
MSDVEYKGIKAIYHRQYKKLLIIPALIVILSFVVILLHYSATGEFFKKDVSLKGGVTITVPRLTGVDIGELETYLQQNFPQADISVRAVSQAGIKTGIVLDAGIEDDKSINELLGLLQQKVGKLTPDDYAIQTIGSSIGASFLKEAMFALILAFVAMAVAVFIYFRVFLPSLFVIWTAFVDMVCTFAAMILLDVHISTAGLAAFLMLIGYSVDTDILLTSRVLKNVEGTVFERVLGAMRTGLTMSLSALVAVMAGLFLAESETIKQIMLVLVVGLVFDIMHTWLTNASILRWWAERKQR